MFWIIWEPPAFRPKFCQRRSNERLSLRMLAPWHPSTMDSHHPGTRHSGLALGTCHASPPDVTVEDVTDILCIWLRSSQTQRWTNLNKNTGSLTSLCHVQRLRRGSASFPAFVTLPSFSLDQFDSGHRDPPYCLYPFADRNQWKPEQSSWCHHCLV